MPKKRGSHPALIQDAQQLNYSGLESEVDQYGRRCSVTLSTRATACHLPANNQIPRHFCNIERAARRIIGRGTACAHPPRLKAGHHDSKGLGPPRAVLFVDQAVASRR